MKMRSNRSIDTSPQQQETASPHMLVVRSTALAGMPSPSPSFGRLRAQRRLLFLGIAAAFASPGAFAQPGLHPQRRWFDHAELMRQKAMASGDQPFGAVLVAPNGVVAEGPSRVVTGSDPDSHAERVAIREAKRIMETDSLAGAVLYSTSRPCRLCEQAAAQAGVIRMYFGPQLLDAGVPRS